MSRIGEMFEAKRKTGNAKPSFMPYVCCGDPSQEFTLRLVETLVSSGASAIEFGIPFSDPIADGKTIQAASARSLAAGMTPAKAVETIALLRRRGVGVPIIAMTYYNIIFANGTEKFLKSLKAAGADGLIVPDVPIEESGELRKKCAQAGIEMVQLITPNCPDARISRIAASSGGFLYAVSVLGITGARDKVAPEALDLVKRAKKLTSLPIAVGFGISKPEHANALAQAGADGVIVGSEIVNLYTNAKNGEEALAEIAAFAKSMSGK